jgi:DNA-directed RNA polymerase subunit alpha
VERARVGQRTNYDKLVIEIWTDGTVRPEDALSEAAKVLIKHLTPIAGIEHIDDYHMLSPIGGDSDEDDKDDRRVNELYEKPIEELDLSVRVFNSLKRTGITTIGDVLDMLDRGPDAMLAIRNFGEKSLDELVEKLQDKGYLKDDAEIPDISGSGG